MHAVVRYDAKMIASFRATDMISAGAGQLKRPPRILDRLRRVLPASTVVSFGVSIGLTSPSVSSRALASKISTTLGPHGTSIELWCAVPSFVVRSVPALRTCCGQSTCARAICVPYPLCFLNNNLWKPSCRFDDAKRAKTPQQQCATTTPCLGMALLEALFVGSVLVAMLSLLFMGWKTPEIVVRCVLCLSFCAHNPGRSQT